VKPRKSKDIKSSLLKKGFELNPEKQHHEFYYLVINGKKQRIYTYFSHSIKEYNTTLLSLIKNQLKFNNNSDFEQFIDCPFTLDDYIKMLDINGDITLE
jgi:hypothetical protein